MYYRRYIFATEFGVIPESAIGTGDHTDGHIFNISYTMLTRASKIREYGHLRERLVKGQEYEGICVEFTLSRMHARSRLPGGRIN